MFIISSTPRHRQRQFDCGLLLGVWFKKPIYVIKNKSRDRLINCKLRDRVTQSMNSLNTFDILRNINYRKMLMYIVYLYINAVMSLMTNELVITLNYYFGMLYII